MDNTDGKRKMLCKIMEYKIIKARRVNARNYSSAFIIL